MKKVDILPGSIGPELFYSTSDVTNHVQDSRPVPSHRLVLCQRPSTCAFLKFLETGYVTKTGQGPVWIWTDNCTITR